MEITASKLQRSSSAGGRRGDGDSGEIETFVKEVKGCMTCTKSGSEEKLKTECILFRRGHRCLQQARSARTAWDQLDELWSEKEDMKEPQKTCVIAAKAARHVLGLDTRSQWSIACGGVILKSERERKGVMPKMEKHQYTVILFRAQTPEGWQYQQCHGTTDACTRCETVFADPQLFRLHVSDDGWKELVASCMTTPRKPSLGNIHNNLPGVMSLEEWMAGGVRRFTL